MNWLVLTVWDTWLPLSLTNKAKSINYNGFEAEMWKNRNSCSIFKDNNSQAKVSIEYNHAFLEIVSCWNFDDRYTRNKRLLVTRKVVHIAHYCENNDYRIKSYYCENMFVCNLFKLPFLDLLTIITPKYNASLLEVQPNSITYTCKNLFSI